MTGWPRLSAQLDWDLGNAALTAISAYRWWDWDPANDGDGTALPIITNNQQANRQSQFSQELRIASQGDGPLSYVAGLYYFWQIVRGYGAMRYGSAAALWNFPTANQTVANAALDGFEAGSTSTPETKTLAVFGQADWKLAESLTLTAGLRFTHERKRWAFSQAWVAGNDLSTLAPAQVIAAKAIRTQLHPVTSYSRGNKSGGLNLTNLPAGISPDVAPEKVDAFELSFKSQFLDRRLTLNGAFYWTEISTTTLLAWSGKITRDYAQRTRISGLFTLARRTSFAGAGSWATWLSGIIARPSTVLSPFPGPEGDSRASCAA